jgi:hypothetical protein
LHPLSDLLVLKPVGSQQDYAAALGYANRRGPPSHKRVQLAPYFHAQRDRWRYAHVRHLYCM